MASNSTFEPETIPAVRTWFEQMGQVVYGMSPLSLPELPTHVDHNDKNGNEHQEVIHFLDDVKERFGSQSLIYVS